MMKRIIALASALVIMTCGCGPRGPEAQNTPAPGSARISPANDVAETSPASSPAVDTSETSSDPAEGVITLPEGYTAAGDTVYMNGRLYIGANDGRDPDDTWSANAILAADIQGGAAEVIYGAENDIQKFAPASDESLWVLTGVYDQENAMWSFSLIHAGADRGETEVSLSDLLDIPVGDAGFYNINFMFPADEGGVTLCVGGNTFSVVTLDAAGTVTSAADVSGGWFNSLTRLDTGELAGLFSPFDGIVQGDAYLAALDPISGTVTKLGIDSDEALNDYTSNYTSVLAGDGETLWLQIMSTVRPYRRSDGTLGEGDMWINMGVNDYDLLTSFLAEGTLWTAEKSPEGVTVAPLRTGADDRQVLTLATMRTDWILTPAVAAFNRENPDYRIEVHNYTAEDPILTQAVERFNYDIIAGVIPDLYYLEDMPYDTLVKQGLLGDLSDYVNQMDMSGYMENILCAPRQEDGALYSLIPVFRLDTLAAPAEAGLTAADITVPNFIRWQAEHPETGIIEADSSEAYTLYSLIKTDLERYVNFDDASCSFDSQEFIDLMTMVRDMPKSEYDDGTGTVISEAPYLLVHATLENYAAPADLREEEGFDPMFVGDPGPTGGVMAVLPSIELAMSSQTAAPDACWKFISYFLSESFQNKTMDIESGFDEFPVMRSALDAGAQLFLQYGLTTQEDIDYVNEILSSTDLYVYHRFSLAEDVLNIVFEESSSFFQEQCTAEAAAANIQSRVGLYLAEHL